MLRTMEGFRPQYNSQKRSQLSRSTTDIQVERGELDQKGVYAVTLEHAGTVTRGCTGSTPLVPKAVAPEKVKDHSSLNKHNHNTNKMWQAEKND